MIRSRLEWNDTVWVNTVTGDTIVAELFDVGLGWQKHPRYRPEIPVLWDCRRAILQVSLDQVRTHFQDSVDQVNEGRPSGKTAWLVSYKTTALILEEIIEHIHWAAEWRVFHDTQARSALIWLLGDAYLRDYAVPVRAQT